MTPEEKAKELIESFSRFTEPSDCKCEAKQCAFIAVEQIENALIDCGELSDQLQNMDRELNYWQKVRKAIETI